MIESLTRTSLAAKRRERVFTFIATPIEALFRVTKEFVAGGGGGRGQPRGEMRQSYRQRGEHFRQTEVFFFFDSFETQLRRNGNSEIINRKKNRRPETVVCHHR